MQDRSDAVAILLDEEELAQLFDGWPDGMRLAVCLDHGGSCAMLVHHRDEDGRILRRIAETLDRAEGSFCVVPGRPGVPTRRMMFSEERRLLSLVAENTDLVEFAADYALNYSFAMDEGLDVEAVVTGRAARPAVATAPSDRVPVDTAPGAPAAASPTSGAPEAEPAPLRALREAPPQAQPAARRPAEAPRRRASPEPQPEPAIRANRSEVPDGFHALAPEEQQDGLFADALLSLGRSGEVRLTLDDAEQAAEGLPIRELYFRNDLQSFAIPARAFAGHDSLPPKLIFAETQLPRAMVASLGRGPQQVRLTASGSHLYVGLVSAMPVLRATSAPPPATAPAPSPSFAPAAASPPAPQPKPSRPRLSRRLLRGGIGGGALVAGLLLALQLGLSPAFSGTDGPSAVNVLRDAIFARIEH